jgi:hypothetical protein
MALELSNSKISKTLETLKKLSKLSKDSMPGVNVTVSSHLGLAASS